ncbi:GNAT family N-acetyltransferase [Bacillus sp. 1P06AnD]|uniref:GNAT family N-acetyltransferase n=1 Tax=Bacillus sp. 1P06AnD TaxID=3132208 RepID=UPI0039A382E6
MNPLLLEFPTEFYTERLQIRMPEPGDGKVIFDAFQASINELKPWMLFAQKEQSEEEAEIIIRDSYVKFIKREDLQLLVFHKDTGEFIASSGLHRIDWSVRKFEIGYWIDSRYSGKGYITEAVQGIATFAFNDLKARRIEIRCDSRNVKSRKIPERIGFTLEGILKSNAISVDGNGLRDTCIYAKVK